MKNDRKKFIKNLKFYNLIMSNIWLMITTILLGIIIGYFLGKNSKNEDNYYLLYSTIIAFIIGICNFFYGIYRGLKKHDQIGNENNEEKDCEDVKKDDSV